MKKTYFSILDYHPNRPKVIIKLAATVTLTLFLMTNKGQAAKPDNYTVNAQNKIEDVRVTQLHERNSSDVTFEESKLTISLHDNEATCADMINAAVQRLGLNDEALNDNSSLIDMMMGGLKSVPATKVTADYDSRDHSLEIVFLLKGGLLVSVSKSVSSIDNDYVLLTFIYKRNVVWAGEVSLNEVAEHICSIDSKL